MNGGWLFLQNESLVAPPNRREFINGLKKVVRALESADFPMGVDQMWNDCFPALCQGDAKTSQDMMGFLTGLKSTFEELGHLLGTLECLTSSLKRTMPLVKAKCESMVLSYGISTAPVDVLDRIFEMACCEDIQMAFRLSLVNKRFHDIVMRNPRLWNKISNYDDNEGSTPGQLQVCLKRSKDVGLDVELDFDIGLTFVNGVEIIDMVSREASRWENVYYDMGGFYSEAWLDLFRDISRYSTDLNLLRLKSADLRYPGLPFLDETDSESITDLSEPLMHFYTTWHLPNLTKLTVHNLFPRPFLHFAPPLTTLTLDIRESNSGAGFERVYDMNLLLEFLRSSPLLEAFRLHLDSFISSTRDDDHTLPETILPNLLTFEFTASHLTTQSLLPFMKALRLPNLRNLHIYVETETEAIDVGDRLDCVLPHSYEHYMNAEVFSYKTSSWIENVGPNGHYDVPFAKLHNLRSMTLETPHSKPNIWRSRHGARTGAMRLPRLKDICFVQCNSLDAVELMLFREMLEEQGKWDTLKEVSFKGCYSLSESTVRSLFEGKDVTWEEEIEE